MIIGCRLILIVTKRKIFFKIQVCDINKIGANNCIFNKIHYYFSNKLKRIKFLLKDQYG